MFWPCVLSTAYLTEMNEWMNEQPQPPVQWSDPNLSCSKSVISASVPSAAAWGTVGSGMASDYWIISSGPWLRGRGLNSAGIPTWQQTPSSTVQYCWRYSDHSKLGGYASVVRHRRISPMYVLWLCWNRLALTVHRIAVCEPWELAYFSTAAQPQNLLHVKTFVRAESMMLHITASIFPSSKQLAHRPIILAATAS